MIFPEIDYDKVEKIHGMDITFVTTTTADDLAMALLRELGMPFRGETPQQSVVNACDSLRERRHGEDAMDREEQAEAEVQGADGATAASAAAGPARFCGSSASAVSASVSWR